ncbi:MAG: hypothetical protein NTY66_03120 [Candidatus Vogelbacteria bacterium]|nr:hypothetical protein [Candidatus Vogelbacteria bacterium]
MNRKWLLLVGTADLLILSLLDKLAFRYFLYWKYGWFDILMHLGGGLAIGLLSTWAYFELLAKSAETGWSWGRLLTFNLSFAVAIGAIWELFEVLVDRIIVFNWFDSVKDTLVGIGGSLLAGLIIGYLRSWPKQNS